MKRLYISMLAVLSILLLLSLAACGTTKVSGEQKTYCNAAKTFSIQLPSEDDETWKVSGDAADDELDISDKNDTINIQVQCLPKNDAEYIAADLESYEQYSMINTLENLLSSMTLEEAKIDIPDFIINSDAQSLTLEDEDNTVKGVVIFMESDSCYYTYLIMAVDKTYDDNEEALLQSVTSLKEL